MYGKFWRAGIRARGREGEKRREKVRGGVKGVNRNVFDPWQTDVEEKLSSLCKGPPELAGSRAQMALCSKPSTNEQIERWKRRGGSLAGAMRTGERFGVSMMAVFFSWHGYSEC